VIVLPPRINRPVSASGTALVALVLQLRFRINSTVPALLMGTYLRDCFD
jgi:hypothetical protein